MLSSNGRRVFIDNKSSLTCYDFNVVTEQWDKFGANFTSGFKKDGKVVKNSQNNAIGFAASKGGNVVVAHNMGTNNIDVYRFNLKTSIWKKIQTITNVETDNSESGSYAIDFKGDNFVLFVKTSSNTNDLYYYAYNTSTKTYDNKFTISGASGITNNKSLLMAKINGDGTRFVIGDTNGNVFDTVNDNGNGVVKVYDVTLSNYSYSLNSTLSSSNDSSLFGNAISINRTGNRIAISEPLEHKYYIYDYNEGTSSWSVPTGFTLNSEDNTSSRYNNVIEFNKLGDALFIGEYDESQSEKGLVFGYYYDNSGSSWEQYQTLSGEFYSSDASGAINQFSSSTTFTDSYSFGSLLSVSDQGTTLLVGCDHLANINNNDNALIIKDPVASTKTFTNLGLSGEAIIQLGLTPKELVTQGGLSVSEMKTLGVSANTLLLGGKTEIELYNNTYTICDIAGADTSDLSGLINDASLNVSPLDFLDCANVTVQTLLNKNITKNNILNDISDSGDISLNISDFKLSGFTSTELNNVGISLKELLIGGYNTTELVNAGFSVSDMKNIELTASDLKRAGLDIGDLSGDYDAADLLLADFTNSEFTNAGYTVEDTKTIQQNIGAVTFSQEVKSVIKNDNVNTLTTSLPSEDDLKLILSKNPSITNMIKVTAVDASSSPIYDISSGPVALTLDFPNLDVNKSYSLCKYDSYNRLMDPQPKGYPAPLTYNKSLGKFTTSLINLSSASPVDNDSAPDTTSSSLKLYLSGVNSSGVSTIFQNSTIPLFNGNAKTLSIYVMLPQFMVSNNLVSTDNWISHNCNILSIGKQWYDHSNRKIKKKKAEVIKTIYNENVNDIVGDKPIGWWSVNSNGRTAPWNNTWNKVYQSYSTYIIKIKANIPFGTTPSSENQYYVENIPGKILIDGHGYIQETKRFSVYHASPPPPSVISFSIESVNAYIHNYTDENGSEVKEYYVNGPNRLKILAALSASTQLYTTNFDNFIYKNCSLYFIQHKFPKTDGINLSFWIQPSMTSSITTVSVSIPKDSLVSVDGNITGPLETQNDIIQVTIDTEPPTIELYSLDMSSNEVYTNGTLGIIIKANKYIRDVLPSHFDIQNGTIENIQRVSGKYNEYSAIIRPTVAQSEMLIIIKTKTNIIQDFAGNFNNAPSNSFFWNYDGISPYIVSLSSTTIGSNDYYNTSSITIDIEFNENIVNLETSDFSVTNGTVSNLQGSGKSYSIDLSPTDLLNSSEIILFLKQNTIKDVNGRSNISNSNVFIWNYDLTKPVISITSSKSNNASSNDAMITYTINSTKDILDISLGSFEVTNAVLFDLQGSGKSFTVKLSPLSNQQTTLYVKANAVTDVTNNKNTSASNQYNWTYNDTKPVIIIRSDDIDLQGKNTSQSISVSIIANTLDLLQSHLTVTGGTISNFSKNTETNFYSCTFTSNAPFSNSTLSVPEDTLQNDTGNGNQDSNVLIWEWDKQRPKIDISSPNLSNNGYSNANDIKLLFTPNQDIGTSFSIDDISSNATISNFETSGNNYIASLRPTENVQTIEVVIPENTIEDSYGFNNLVASDKFTWYYDNINPEISISSTFMESNTTNNLTSITIDCSLSKPLETFNLNIINAMNLTKSQLTKIDDLNYTVKLDLINLNAITTNKIFIKDNTIQDKYGNYNFASNIFIWRSDVLKPKIINIYAIKGETRYMHNVGYEYTKSDFEDLEVHFEFNKAVLQTSVNTSSFNIYNTVDQEGNKIDFVISDISRKDNKYRTYKMKFRPSNYLSDNYENDFPEYFKGSFNLRELSVSDRRDNYNDVSGESFTLIYDRRSVVVSLSAVNSNDQSVVSGTTTNDEFIYVDIRASKMVVQHLNNPDAIITNNCNISEQYWSIDNISYRMKVTPISRDSSVSISVNDGLFKEYINTSKLSTASETTFTWSSDITNPILSITSPNVNDSGTIAVQDISLNFSFDEAITSNMQVSDLSYTNGTIIENSFSGSGTSYSLSFRVNETGGIASVFLPTNNTLTDAAGNNTVSNKFTWNYGVARPTIESITSDDVSLNGYTSKSEITIKIQTSDPVTMESSIIEHLIANGSLVQLDTLDDINFNIVVSINNATSITESSVILSIPKDAYYQSMTGGAKVYNDTTNEFKFNYFNNVPNLSLNSTSVVDGGITNTNSIQLLFQESNFTEIYDFVANDITIYPDNSTLYNITNFLGSDGSHNFSATLNASEDGTIIVSVPHASYRNKSLQTNDDVKTFTWIRDTQDIEFEIYSKNLDSGSSSTDASLTLVIECNKNIDKTIVESNIDISNANLTPLQGDSNGKIFTTTLIPELKNVQSSILIEANTVTDSAGNSNTNDSNTFYWTFTGDSPTVSLSSSSLTNGAFSALSEISMNIVIHGEEITLLSSDIDTTNASISNFVQQSSTATSVTYSLDFVPTSKSTPSTLHVPANVFDDKYGVSNLESSTFSYTYDDTAPTIIVSSTSLTNDDKSNKSFFDFDFDFSTAITGFTLSDIEVSGGSFESLIDKGNNKFSSRLIPSVSSGDITVSVPENKVSHSITDVSNTVSNTFTIDYDNNPVLLEISANVARGSSNNTYDVEMTITSNKAIVDFSKDKILSNNCIINNEQTVNDSTYKIFVNPIKANEIVSINILEGVFTDNYGNTNNEVSGGTYEWDFDTEAVFINLKSTELNDLSGTVLKNAVVNFVATIDDDNEQLTKDDLSFNNLSIETFTKRAGQSIYDIKTETITKGQNTSFNIPAGVIQDSAGNNNLESSTFSWIYDTSLPEVVITSSDISDNGTTNTSSIDLIFTMSKAVQNFDLTDIATSNGFIETDSLEKISSLVYHATLVASSGFNGIVSVQVNEGEIQDEAFSGNKASNTFKWNCDTIAPQFVIGFKNILHSNGLILEEEDVSMTTTIINGEDISSISLDDFTVINGTLSNLVQDSSFVYSFNFNSSQSNTVSSLYIDKNQFSDTAGNNNSKSNTLTWTYYNKPLLVESISANVVQNNGITNINKVRLSFSLSEVATNLEGTSSLLELTNVQYDNNSKIIKTSDTGKDYSVDLIVNSTNTTDNPSRVSLKTDVDINILNNGFSLTKNIQSTSSNLNFVWVYDNVKPTMSIYSSAQNNNATSNVSSIDLTFESTKDIDSSTFTSSDIVIFDDIGTLSDLSGSGKIYNATLSPNDISSGSIVVNVNPGAFKDTVGNEYESDISFTWNYDILPPTIDISSSVSSGTSNDSAYIDISFLLSEEIKENFVDKVGEIVTVTDGRLTDVSGSGTSYSAKLNPTAPNTQSKIVILPNKISDLAGNENDSSSNEYTWTYNGEALTLNLTSDDVSAGGYHKNNSITVKLVASSSITSNFTTSNISVTNGSASNLSNTDSGAGELYEFTVTSSVANSETVVTIAADEIASNLNNNLASSFTWTYDNIKPTLSISAERINGDSLSSNQYNNDDYVKLLFNFSEDISFSSSVVDLSNGSLSNFKKVDSTNYSAHLHPSSVGLVSAVVPPNSFFDVAENYNDASSNTFLWNYDNVAPTINIYSNDISDNESSDISSVTLIIEASEAIKGLSASSFTIKNSIIDSLSGSDGDVSYSLVLRTSDFTNNQNATISIPRNTISDLASNLNSSASNTFRVKFNKEVTRKKEVSEIESIFQNDSDISNDEIPDSYIINDIVSTSVDTLDDSGDGISINYVTATMNRKIYKRLMEQMFERNTKKKLRMNRDNIPIKASTLQILKNNSRSKIVVADSNQSVNYSDLASTSSTDEGIFIPLSSINDYIELTINNGEKFKFIQTSADVYKMEKYNSGGTKVTEDTYDEDDSFTYLGYTFIFGGVTGYYNPPDGEDSSSNVIPCFLKDTMILTTNGYKSIQDIKPGKDMLVDYEGKSLKCLEIKGFNQKFDNEHFPYVVPKGAQIGTTMKCVKDLYLTYNHCIYMPHIDKFVPSYRMNLQQDKTKVEDYTYYHIFTENYFSDIIIANGVPCETHSKYVLKSIKSIDNSGKLLYTLYQHCGAENDGLRKRIEPKMFNKIVKKFSKKNKKKNSKVQK